jgi:hypothetical protein
LKSRSAFLVFSVFQAGGRPRVLLSPAARCSRFSRTSSSNSRSARNSAIILARLIIVFLPLRPSHLREGVLQTRVILGAEGSHYNSYPLRHVCIEDLQKFGIVWTAAAPSGRLGFCGHSIRSGFARRFESYARVPNYLGFSLSCKGFSLGKIIYSNDSFVNRVFTLCGGVCQRAMRSGRSRSTSGTLVATNHRHARVNQAIG